MAKIIRVRPVLLSAPYADALGNLEVRLHLPAGLRTTGLVEITLDNGIVGLGEGYLAVFAPHVFVSMVDLLGPALLGRHLGDLPRLCRELSTLTGYWSLQGAAQHVISALEIALQDCAAQALGIPLWQALGGVGNRALRVYASGGDSINPAFMADELRQIADLGIDTFKIRARNNRVDKVLWCQREGAKAGISIAVDMTQNLAIPSQSVDEVLIFLHEIETRGGTSPVFIEEVLGPDAIDHLPELRRSTRVPVAGGEIVTTPRELRERIRAGCYGIVQPDATVIGGVGPVLDIFAAARREKVEVYVHCWGGAVGMLANYHAALAGGGEVVEWPLPHYPVREALLSNPLQVIDGKIRLTESPGLGVRLTPEIEKEFPFREEAVYHCLVDPAEIPVAAWDI